MTPWRQEFSRSFDGKEQVIAELNGRARQWGAGIGQSLWRL